MKKIVVSAIVIAVCAAVVFTACSKDKDANGTTTLKVRMTDAPTLADEVNVDIREVRVRFGDDTLTGWTSLSTYAGVYDLLGLQNGVDTLLAVGSVPTGMVREIRFVLGSNNSIKVGGVLFPLTIPSGSESGLKIKVNKQLSASLDSLLIDFDAALSVHQTGSGDYHLKPVLKIK
ncbi:MAG: DUF4382 domain-containing protein [Chitinophagaceae bacterium]|nr:DUF4382 domain-containing protein [Chitinophagaceae bacterium]